MLDLEVSSWVPRDLSAVMAGQGVPPPSILMMDDGRCLFYRGRINGIHGEPEGGKSWLALLAVVQVLLSGGRALYLDYEDDENGIVERLRALGAHDSLISGTRFAYVRPEEPLGVQGDGVKDFLHLLAGPMFDVVVIDSMNEAMTLEGFDPLSNRDAGVFTRRLQRRVVQTGACSIQLDHVTKATDGRGKWPIGAQQKRAMIRGASYVLENVRPFGRGLTGEARIVVAKDSPGHVRTGVGLDQPVAAFTLASDVLTGRAVYRLTAPAQGHQIVVDRVLAYIEVNPGCSKRALRALSNSDIIDQAVEELEINGIIRVEKTGTLHAHFLSSEASPS